MEFRRNRNDQKLLTTFRDAKLQIGQAILKYGKNKPQDKPYQLGPLFQDLQGTLRMPELNPFKDYIQNADNLPFQYGRLENLTYEMLVKLFEQWLESRQVEHEGFSMASSEEWEEEPEPMVSQITSLMKHNHQSIDEFLKTVDVRERLDDYHVYNFLKACLGDSIYLYEYRSDQQHFFEKANTFPTMLSIIRSFKQSQRFIKPSDDSKFIYVKEIPFLMSFWHKQNSELCLQKGRRKDNKLIQTSLNKSNNTNDLLGSHVRREEMGVPLETIFNTMIHQLKQKLSMTHETDIKESLQFLIMTIRRQRKKLYPQYSQKINTEPAVNSSLLASKAETAVESHKKRLELLEHIFNHYRRSQMHSIHSSLEHSAERIQSAKVRGFLVDLGVGYNPKTQKNVKAIVRQRVDNQETLNYKQFLDLMEELLPYEQATMTLRKLEIFKNDLIANRPFEKTLRIRGRYGTQLTIQEQKLHRKTPIEKKSPNDVRSPSRSTKDMLLPYRRSSLRDKHIDSIKSNVSIDTKKKCETELSSCLEINDNGISIRVIGSNSKKNRIRKLKKK